jgi:signal transduction histidine kinase
MSVVVVIWVAAASACLTLALMHVAIWLRMPRQVDNLLFSVTATSAATIGAFELALMHADSVQRYATLVRWIHVPVFVLVVSQVWFLRAHLHAGRLWLAWTVCGLRTLALLLNFLSGVNLNFLEIHSLKHVWFLGDRICVVGQFEPNVLSRVGELTSILMLVYVADATISAYRRGEHRRALVVGGATILARVLSPFSAALIHAGLLSIPYSISLAYTLVVAAIAFELSSEVLRASKLGYELKTREGELRESEARMELAAEAAEIGLWVWEVARDKIWTTGKGRQMLGLTEGHPGLDGFLAPIHPDDRALVRRVIEQSLENQASIDVEYRIPLNGDEVRWIAAHGRVERDDSGRAMRMRGASIDVSRRRVAEVESARQRSELTHLSRVTTLGHLSSSLAHELNQPLTSILSNAQAAERFLAQGPVDLAEVREILGDIIEQDKRAGEIIRRLRTLLKKGETERTVIDINELTSDALRMVHSDLINHNVQVKTELADALPKVKGDRVQLQQVVLNLVINACDAMTETPTNRRELLVRTRKLDGRGVQVCVIDRGQGIAPQHLDRIFQPFFTTKSQGMGLGLAVCHTIIAAHNGHLGASNNPDCGATVDFVVPDYSETTT